MGIFDFFYMGKSGNKTSETMDAYIQQQKIDKGVKDFNEEFSGEVAAEKTNAGPDDPINSYSNNGIQLEPAINALKLTYQGILARNGAENISAVIGYGNNLKWEDTETYPMHKKDERTFELLFSPKRSGNINIAFKDGAGNWDNNSGMNYSFVDEF